MALFVRFHFNISGFKNVGKGRLSILWYCTTVWFTVSVDSMAAISGYFGITSKRLNLSRLFTIYIQIRLYMFLGCWIGSKSGWVNMSDPYWWYMVRIPVLNGAYWYASSYLLLAFVSPALNLIGRELTRFQYLVAIIVLLVIEIDNCRFDRQGRRHKVIHLEDGYTACHLAIIYFIAGYFRLHPRLLPRFIFWILYGFTFRWQYNLLHSFQPVREWMSRHYLGPFTCHFWQRWEIPFSTNIVSITLTMLTLLIFEGIPITGSLGNCLSFLAGLTFAVYLIHDHPIWAERLGVRWFRQSEMIGTPAIALYNEYRFTITTFLFCVIVDLYRHYLWETLFNLISFMWKNVLKQSLNFIEWIKASIRISEDEQSSDKHLK
jgi:hypothetical protein